MMKYMMFFLLPLAVLILGGCADVREREVEINEAELRHRGEWSGHGGASFEAEQERADHRVEELKRNYARLLREAEDKQRGEIPEAERFKAQQAVKAALEALERAQSEANAIRTKSHQSRVLQERQQSEVNQRREEGERIKREREARIAEDKARAERMQAEAQEKAERALREREAKLRAEEQKRHQSKQPVRRPEMDMSRRGPIPRDKTTAAVDPAKPNS